MSAFSIRWLESGKPVLSKKAPAALKELFATGAFDQDPSAKGLKELASPPNPYNVQVGEVWIDGDARRRTERRVIVLAIEDRHAVVRNLANGRISQVKLDRFSGRPSRYRRGTDANIDSEVRAQVLPDG